MECISLHAQKISEKILKTARLDTFLFVNNIIFVEPETHPCENGAARKHQLAPFSLCALQISKSSVT